MKTSIEYLILNTIKKNASIMTLFRTGYSYTSVMEWCDLLENEGKITFDDNGIRILTLIGNTRLAELKKMPHTKNFNVILPYHQYKIFQMSIEEVYLP